MGAQCSMTVRFGMVCVPAKGHTAQSAGDVRFNQLHDQCNGRLKQGAMRCPVCDTDVPPEHIVKGYEYGKGTYCVFTKDEVKAFEEASDNAIDIIQFVPGDSIDRLTVQKAMYLAPDKGANKAFTMLLTSMQRQGVIAIGNYSARGRVQLVALRPAHGTLVMETLFYKDEIRTVPEFAPATVSEAELDLAGQLIGNLLGTFNHAAHQDTYRERILAAVNEKMSTGTYTAPAPKPQVVEQDMLAALKASLAAMKKAA